MSNLAGRNRRVNFARCSLIAGLGLMLGLVPGVAASAGARSKPAAPDASRQKFEISFPASAHTDPITGRVFVVISRTNQLEPRKQVGFWFDPPPLFGADVSELRPNEPTMIDAATLGYPVESLAAVPAGDYYVQAVMNVYTEFHRSDGHTLWAHMDHWEGQQFNESPGNLYSEVEKVHLDPPAGYDVKLSLAKVIPPVVVPADTEWVKHIKIASKLLTAFWGHPMYVGATVLLPKGYDTHPDVSYPVVYEQGHFNLRPPFGFSTEEQKLTAAQAQFLKEHHYEAGYEFYQKWTSDDFPRVIGVTFQHPTPFFDDSYAVNSANDGPYGDALMTELIPYLETHFRIIRQPYARVLTGGSTGGWESLALQVFHPDFFGGTWTFFPDPIDFRHYGMVDVYKDDNAFTEPGHQWTAPTRYLMRQADGQPEVSIREFSRMEDVLGSHGRSGQQLEAWEAVYGPVGEDGYPRPVWNKASGKIDHDVAVYMRDHGYDLRYNLETNWPKLGPKLVGKLHLFVGDMDNYYLNLAVYDLEDFLKNTKDPYYSGSFEYGRPMKGHGWTPLTQSELIREMAEHVTDDAPAGESPAKWKYN